MATAQTASCPSCGRGFNCSGSADCWCLQVERAFDYEALIMRTGSMSCVCPVCLTGRSDMADVEVSPVRRRSDAKS